MGHIFCTDDQLHIISWDDTLSQLTEKNASEVLGKKYDEVLPRIFWRGIDALQLVLETRKTLSLKGHPFPCLVDHTSADIRITPVRTKGIVKGVKVRFSDFSACSVAQSLRNSQRFIDIGKTASTLAHGVRNPLNAIKGAVLFLSEKYANEAALVEFAKIMNEEIARLDNFISRFLSTSISDAGFRLTDMNALVERMKAFTSLQTQASHIRPVYEFGDIPPVTVNVFLVEQAILNLINNAIAAMKGGGQLVVKTGKETLNCKEYVVIEVSDTGSGIPKSAMDCPSVQADSGGKGFGLFIAREILQYHGGHLEIRSRKGRGTNVRMYLPVNPEESVSGRKP